MTPEQIPQIRNQSPGKPRRRFSNNINQEIDITVRSLLSPGDGPEDVNVPCSMLRGDAEDLLAPPRNSSAILISLLVVASEADILLLACWKGMFESGLGSSKS